MHQVSKNVLPIYLSRCWCLQSPAQPQASVIRDVSDPNEFPDGLGTVCAIHDSPRFTERVPVITTSGPSDFTFFAMKRHFFPNSWTAVSIANCPHFATARRGTVMVRYCPTCRAAA